MLMVSITAHLGVLHNLVPKQEVRLNLNLT